jgi:hypothetical protein
MHFLTRPWLLPTQHPDNRCLGPDDCFLAEMRKEERVRASNTKLLDWKIEKATWQLVLLPYPKTGEAGGPVPVSGLPARLRLGIEPKSEAEVFAQDAAARMHRVIARIEELEAALDDPENTWARLQKAWQRAENEADPRMAEIVRQARNLLPRLQDLERRIRRVLRRHRELTPLDRVQEMDRSSMLWMVRQPGRDMKERAGADQRIMAITRHENFDTLENRVVHSYLRLAAYFARQWLREHQGAQSTLRFEEVERYRRYCRRLSRDLSSSGIGFAELGVTPNYVLMEDRSYRDVWEAWERLQSQEKAEDDLWAWQAESWSDFCALAVTLSLHALEDSELVAQSPILWLGEAQAGRRFRQENPLAVFWLRNSRQIVEVQARPQGISKQQATTKAHVWLRISNLGDQQSKRRVPIWTPHTFTRMDPETEAEEAASLLGMMRGRITGEILREGLILMQGHGTADQAEATNNGCRVNAIALDAVGVPLKEGLAALGAFVRGCTGEVCA